MKRKSKNRGFTIIELLATITVLGIVTVIAVTTIQSVLKKAYNEYYNNQEKNMIAATESYLEKEKKYLPKISGQTVKIFLEDLYKKNLIDKVIDYNKDRCDAKASYVSVFKYENEYYYSPYLECPDYTTNLSKLTSNLYIDIKFSNNITDGSATILITDAATEDKKIPEGIVSYQYKIYKDGKLAYTSDVFNAKKLRQVTKNISLSTYLPGKVKISVTATNMYGLSLTSSFEKQYKDTEKPTCGEVLGGNTVWTTGKKIISVNCSDGNGSGCTRKTFTKEFTGDVASSYITIEDKSGNKRNCPVNVYIDNTEPELTIKAYKKKRASNEKENKTVVGKALANKTTPKANFKISKDTVSDWLNNKNYPNGLYFEIDYKDSSSIKKLEIKWNDSNLSKNSSNVKSLIDANSTVKNPNVSSGSYSTTLTKEGYRYGQIIATDIVGHKSVVELVIPIDRTSPTCTKSGSSTVWTKNTRTLTITCNDPLSGCKSSPGVQKFEKTIKTKSYALEDKAGNTSSCDVNIYVDKTKPSCGNITGASTEWTEKNRKITVGCSDSESGCSKSTTSTTFNKSIKKGAITISDKVGNTTDCTVNAYVDKTPPTCESVHGASTKWVNKSRNIYVNCSDKESGCEKNTYIKEFTKTAKQGKITISDNVGHTTECIVDTYIDKEPPTCGKTSGTSKTWTKSDRTIIQQCDDTGGSGCEAVSKTYDKTTKTSTLTLTDNAGNSTDCKVNVYVDKTAPTCGEKSGESKSWTRWDRFISVGCTDSESGCNKGSFTHNFTETAKTGSIEIQDAVGNSKSCDVDVYVDKKKPSTPTVYLESGNENTSITNNTCNDLYQYHWKDFGDKSCKYTIEKPAKGRYYVLTSNYSYDENSGFDYLQVKFSCNGKGGSYKPYNDWTKIENIGELVSPDTATECTTKVRAVDRVGNISDTLTINSSIIRN